MLGKQYDRMEKAMTTIAIIGAGIVGASAAYYLKKQGYQKVIIFDDGNGQATKAAAGIICPWFSKRRNKAWYQLARLGADCYQDLIKELQKEGLSTHFYKQTGVYLLKKNEDKLEELYQLANRRKQESPLIGDLAIRCRSDIKADFPDLQGFEQLVWASGAARVDGADLCQCLLEASGYQVVKKRVGISIEKQGYLVDGMVFDRLILAAGAWLPELLEPLGYQVDIRPQKGQLIDYHIANVTTDNYAVVMPEGEMDIIPFEHGRLSVGASHENDKGYDLEPDVAVLEALEQEALAYYPKLSAASDVSYRVGIRAYTRDFSPFFGQVPQLPGVYAASGLGSSGLTLGPLIAQQLIALLLGQKASLDASQYPIQHYISRINDKK